MQDLDETGMTLAHKTSKVLTKKGAKAIHGKTFTSRELITVIACGNAAGDYLPPRFVFPGKTRRKLDGCDIESTMERSSSIKGAIFLPPIRDGPIAKLNRFTKTFLKNIGPSRPQLLICDGHESHNNVEFVELAKQNVIIIIGLPSTSNTSSWTQPFFCRVQLPQVLSQIYNLLQIYIYIYVALKFLIHKIGKRKYTTLHK